MHMLSHNQYVHRSGYMCWHALRWGHHLTQPTQPSVAFCDCSHAVVVQFVQLSPSWGKPRTHSADLLGYVAPKHARRRFAPKHAQAPHAFANRDKAFGVSSVRDTAIESRSHQARLRLLVRSGRRVLPRLPLLSTSSTSAAHAFVRVFTCT